MPDKLYVGHSSEFDAGNMASGQNFERGLSSKPCVGARTNLGGSAFAVTYINKAGA
jgi:hypothetical protein